MTKEYLEALNKIQHDFGQLKGQELVSCYETIFNALKRLESIDNSNPSEALECLEFIENKLRGLRVECERIKNHRCDDVFIQEHTFDTIKQALLKAQEPKQYLKWEDLEFDDKEQIMDVSLNGHPHLLCYYRTLFGSLCMIDNTGITIREDNKYFFNDLHLERVEE